jgi:hypothetical protein
MTRLLLMAALAGLFWLPLNACAQNQVVELADVQLTKSLFAAVDDPAGSPLTNVLVQEFSADRKTVLRTTATDSHGRLSLATVQGRKIYYLQLSMPGFSPQRVRIELDRKRGASLSFKLTIAT